MKHGRWAGGGHRRCGGVGGFLVLVASVWVTVLVIFSGALLLQEGRPRDGFMDKPGVKGSDIRRLQLTVEDLRTRIDTLSERQHDAPPSFVRRAVPREEARKQEQAPAVPAVPPEASKGGGSQQYDSSTSPVPLVDPTILTRTDPGWDMELGGLCKHRNDGDEELLRHVKVWEGAKMGSPRILCLSYTLSKVHGTNVRNVRQTWGRRCDGYIAMSDLTDPSVPSVDIKHEGEEAYGNMWLKSRAIWMYVHKHHANDFDYFITGGDDLYVIVDNLRRYLLSDEIVEASAGGTKPLFLGRRFLPPNEKVVFNSGGAGYVLNRPALNLLGEGLKGTQCRPHQVGFWEDVNVAYCLSLAGVTAFDTRDPQGRERFMPFTPGNHLTYRVPKNPDWYAKYSIGLKTGLDCCSPEAVSFHYVKGDLMHRYHALLYGKCEAAAA